MPTQRGSRRRRAGANGRAASITGMRDQAVQVGKRFARALVASALQGQTSYSEAFRLLGLKKASTFDGLADRLGVR